MEELRRNQCRYDWLPSLGKRALSLLSIAGSRVTRGLTVYWDATLRATVSSLSKIMLLVSSSGNTTGSSFFAV